MPAGEVWQCIVNGQKVFSDKRCGNGASVRQIGDLNVMDTPPPSRYPMEPIGRDTLAPRILRRRTPMIRTIRATRPETYMPGRRSSLRGNGRAARAFEPPGQSRSPARRTAAPQGRAIRTRPDARRPASDFNRCELFDPLSDSKPANSPPTIAPPICNATSRPAPPEPSPVRRPHRPDLVRCAIAPSRTCRW